MFGSAKERLFESCLLTEKDFLKARFVYYNRNYGEPKVLEDGFNILI